MLGSVRGFAGNSLYRIFANVSYWPQTDADFTQNYAEICFFTPFFGVFVFK